MSIDGAVIPKTGFLGFGSFFTESVESLVARAAQQSQSGGPDYVPPPKPFDTADLLLQEEGVNLSTLALGSDAARRLFLIDFNAWTFLNHGAFGGVCVPAYREAERWRAHCERQPLAFLDRCDHLQCAAPHMPCHAMRPCFAAPVVNISRFHATPCVWP